MKILSNFQGPLDFVRVGIVLIWCTILWWTNVYMVFLRWRICRMVRMWIRYPSPPVPVTNKRQWDHGPCVEWPDIRVTFIFRKCLLTFPKYKRYSSPGIIALPGIVASTNDTISIQLYPLVTNVTMILSMRNSQSHCMTSMAASVQRTVYDHEPKHIKHHTKTDSWWSIMFNYIMIFTMWWCSLSHDDDD